MSQVSLEDIEYVISDANIPWDRIKNSTFFITGATGLIGGILVHTMSAANKKYDLNLRILAHGRNAAKGEALSEDFGVEFIGSDIRKPLPVTLIADKIDYIFHCAAITKSADMLAKPVEVISTEADGTRNILELAKKKHSKSVVYLSSMEVYGQTTRDEVTEADLGYLDPTDPRNSYPAGKRFCESLCNCYLSQYDVPVKIARLARTFGAGTPNYAYDMRVAMQFARKAVSNEDIVLHTAGNSIANCCYTSDAVSGLLTLLLSGKDGEAYNIGNPAASVTIREMAELVAKKVCSGKISVVVDIPDDISKRGYLPDVTMRLNVDKIKSLGWRPKHGLAEMFRRMMSDWTKG